MKMFLNPMFIAIGLLTLSGYPAAYGFRIGSINQRSWKLTGARSNSRRGHRSVLQCNSLLDAARATIENSKSQLSPELQTPPSVAELEKYLEKAVLMGESSEQETAALIFAVMCDQATLFRQDGETGYMSESISLDLSRPESFKDDMMFKKQVKYVYSYGMKMAMGNLIDIDDLKACVLDRLAARVGMDGGELDEWLEM
uniref:Uncharacterized protein n=1 Tax=Octactis speculum TaxID=3111310 RepID=A0A7S2HIB8_9STRA|mmetsp:Transcript_6566/g.8117  ORF Transcript_6566/g.8117 Transcript_6566/m.8117 type:complete len:199 (+) Transcript_6566:13-609(+)|eukprot:CAMPEP_0185746944 /NCGR_PEP_ID=MMETSP1174-20130828/5609_1 /TAXON_ID=35687 /ORGANISM="Dictyocha speculum, Strain CCMP1381" /LENGTH=198 /DNA_ID=CAMNT_0028421917 /DNA_START=13 /DNA_END=609 /DNA_ORIENTATION=+